MKLVDAFTGDEVIPGRWMLSPTGRRWRLKNVPHGGIFSVEVVLEYDDRVLHHMWLPVDWTFKGRKVFIPT